MTFSARRAARRCLALVAALALTAPLSAIAYAQETDTPVTTTTEAAPSTTTEPPVTTTPPAEPGKPEQADTPASPAADLPKLEITATVAAGPFLLNQQIPVELTIANNGDTDVSGVKADVFSASGSSFVVLYTEWGELSTWKGAGVTVPAGQKFTKTVHGEYQQWSGVPLARFYVQVGTSWVDTFDLAIPLRDPASGTDTLAGLVYGDRNGNNAPDAGEGLAGADVRIYLMGNAQTTKTDAEGRFRFTDLPLRVYSVSVSDAPGGWVVQDSYRNAAVDGQGSAADLVFRSVRPLTDQLSASMRFTRDLYNVGDRADIEVTLTNSGTADLPGIQAFCDRSGGEGPELRNVDLRELGRPGTTVPAGQTRTFTISGDISEETAQYGGVAYGCDFGTGDDPGGHPGASALAKVPAPPATLRMAFYHDRNGDNTGRDDEMVGNLSVGVKDAITGKLVAKGRTDAQGHVVFQDLPAGPYEIRVYGPWKFSSDYGHVLFAGSCGTCKGEAWMTVVPGPEVPEEELEPGAAAPGGDTGGGAANTGGLADTGASVLGLLGLGALALVGGVGAVVVSRRRTA